VRRCALLLTSLLLIGCAAKQPARVSVACIDKVLKTERTACTVIPGKVDWYNCGPFDVHAACLKVKQ
jgi:hypothetical protein